jgi:hypothetical protein
LTNKSDFDQWLAREHPDKVLLPWQDALTRMLLDSSNKDKRGVLLALAARASGKTFIVDLLQEYFNIYPTPIKVENPLVIRK